MIEELEGTVAETLYRLGVETLDPRDESLFCDCFWEKDTGPVWELRGRFLASGYRFRLRHAGDHTGVREITDAIRANRDSAPFREAWHALVPHLEAWLRIGRANPWIREADDPPFSERSFALCRTPEDVAREVDRNNWTVGTAFVLADTDVCMIQQCEGPGEFLMLRGPVAFDSWTTGKPFIHGAELVAYLQAVVRAPLDARGRPLWYELVQQEAGTDAPDAGVHVAATAADLTRLLQ